MIIESMSKVRNNFIADQLRSQINALQAVLTDIEEGNEYYENWVEESIAETIEKIESSLRKIRKLYLYN